MQGTILKYDRAEGVGILRSAEGTRLTFKAAEWNGPRDPMAGDIVDFEIGENEATALYVTKRASLAAAALDAVPLEEVRARAAAARQRASALGQQVRAQAGRVPIDHTTISRLVREGEAWAALLLALSFFLTWLSTPMGSSFGGLGLPGGVAGLLAFDTNFGGLGPLGPLTRLVAWTVWLLPLVGGGALYLRAIGLRFLPLAAVGFAIPALLLVLLWANGGGAIFALIGVGHYVALLAGAALLALTFRPLSFGGGAAGEEG